MNQSLLVGSAVVTSAFHLFRVPDVEITDSASGQERQVAEGFGDAKG